MPTQALLQSCMHMIEKEEKINKLHTMLVHWNDCNLNGLASLLSSQVELITPPIQIGPVPLGGRELTGIHHVLKFWKELFKKFSFSCNNARIIDIRNNITTVVIDYPDIKMSAKCNLQFNKEGQISAMHFYKVMELGLEEEAKAIPLMLRLFGNRIKTRLSK